MKKTSVLATCMMTVFVVLFTRCTDTKTKIAENAKNDSKEVQSILKTKTSTAEVVKDDNKEIQSKLEKYMKSDPNGEFNGSILVAKNEQILFESGYGMSDFHNKIPNTPQTIFQIGSLTKQFTATAILMLKEKGLLSTEDTVDKYMPDYPNGNKINLYNLLNHTSGIPEYLKFIESMESGKHSYNTMELIEIFKDKTLDFEPGTDFKYSNSNYILLGYIIEKLTGTSYEDYIKNNIFIPLKMNHTGMLNSKDTVNGTATGYSYIGTESAVKYPTIEPSLPFAAGEIYSTTEDLLIWINNLCSGKLISESSLQEMFTPNTSGFGFGWAINKTEEGEMIFHGGSIPGFTSYISRNTNKGYTIIVLSNIDSSQFTQYVTNFLFGAVSGQ